MKTELKRKRRRKPPQVPKPQYLKVKVGIQNNAGRYPEVVRQERDDIFFGDEELVFETFEQKPKISQVARWNCEGTATIPARDFLTAAIGKRLTFYRRFMLSLLKNMLLGRLTAKRAIATLGLRAQNDMKDTIRNWKVPANAASTVRRKGKNDPLVDTELMVDTIKWKVQRE